MLVFFGGLVFWGAGFLGAVFFVFGVWGVVFPGALRGGPVGVGDFQGGTSDFASGGADVFMYVLFWGAVVGLQFFGRGRFFRLRDPERFDKVSKKRATNPLFQENSQKTSKKFASFKIMPTFAIPNEKNGSPNAEIAQLVEHNLAKVGVASSSLVFRSERSA